MRITSLGHAGLVLESQGQRLVCDPWFTPAFFGSWYPFPSNDHIDPESIAHPTHLYISHLHLDHFDERFLAQTIDKSTPVLLPEHPLPLLENRLRSIGFTNFIKTRHNRPMPVGPWTVMITSLAEPSDGAIGDSSILIDDGEVRVLNLNDARPIELEPLLADGPIDALFLQYSGAIWYPMVYDFPPRAKEAWGRKKRAGGMARAIRYVEGLSPRHVIPSAGPACFLDPDLFEWNDFDRDPSNPFPSQDVFLEQLEEHGHRGGTLMMPGSTGDLTPDRFAVTHPQSGDALMTPYRDKRRYLEAYQARVRDTIEQERASWRSGLVDVEQELASLLNPLLEDADHLCAGVNDVVLLQIGDVAMAVDFRKRRVRRWQGEDWVYRFEIPRPLMERCLLDRVEDWTNDLFLSFRFRASRRGPYNQNIFIFFRCLTRERLQYAEGRLSEQGPTPEFWEIGGYRMPRRCPHAKGDLARFGVVEDGILTCRVHNWQFDLASGQCLTSDGYRLNSIPIGPPEPGASPPAVAPTSPGGPGPGAP